MDQNKLTTSSNSLELDIQDLKIPSLSDFSKVKVVLTVNNYTQCLAYPFKSMTIPSVDDFSVLEISVLQQNSIVADIEVPVTLFKNKKSQTFKLQSHRKQSGNRIENNEITLAIKFWPNNSPIDVYKEHIKELEMKVKESEEKVEVGMKSKRELQGNFEEITKNLAKMIKNQEETINSLVLEKEKMNEYLKGVENGFRSSIGEDSPLGGKIFVTESIHNVRRMKSFELNSKKPFLKRKQDKSASLGKDSQIYIEKLENELRTVKKENENLKNSEKELQLKIEDLEYKLSEMSVSTSGEKASEKQSNEGIVLSLRGEMVKLAAKYKNRIAKLSESRNTLISENKILTEKNLELERQLYSRTPDLSKSPETKPNPYKLLGKFVNNVKKVESYMNKSPKPEKGNEDLNKYLQIVSTPPNIRKKTPENKTSRGNKDALDVILEEYSRKMDLTIQFVKETDGVYVFGSKRVYIKLENNKVFVRIGSGFMPIEEFIKVYLPLEVEKMDRGKEKDLRTAAFAREEKIVTCFGVQRRSASVSKLPSKIVNNYN